MRLPRRLSQGSYSSATLMCWHRRILQGVCHGKSRAKRRLSSHASHEKAVNWKLKFTSTFFCGVEVDWNGRVRFYHKRAAQPPARLGGREGRSPRR